jgi:hypothetical protein
MWVIFPVEMAKRSASTEMKPLGAPSFTEAQVAYFKSKMLELRRAKRRYYRKVSTMGEYCSGNSIYDESGTLIDTVG